MATNYGVWRGLNVYLERVDELLKDVQGVADDQVHEFVKQDWPLLLR